MNAAKKTQAKPLLVELGTEELPPKALKKLATQFASRISEWLAHNGFIVETKAEYQWFATPRRLAVIVDGVLAEQPDQVQERRGPAIKAAFDGDGNPTRAAQGFAGSCGVEVEALERIKTDKGEWLAYRSEIPGQTLGAVIADCINFSLDRLPIPKRMRWGTGQAEFVRPVHWLVLLHGSQLLEAKVLGIESGQYSRGHRFHADGPIRISSAGRYAELLKEKGSVWVDYEERKLEIHLQTEKAAKKLSGTAIINDSLLEEVTGLVEYPEAISGRFDERFLDVPREALISSMRDHQKYFHLVDDHGKLMPNFVTISNIHSKDPERVRSGNERVLRARLADAEFFWNEDRKKPLAVRVATLKGLVFHRALGSVYDKTQRIMNLARPVARDHNIDVEASARAAELCKADLVSSMVGEFPELQGTMGRYYASHDGEREDVARAIEEHYLPRHAGDDLPGSPVGRLVSIADKIDTLTGIFASGEEPTGDKDPYGLRRISLGLIRTLIEGGLDIDIADLIEASADIYVKAGIEVSADARSKAANFVTERYPAYYAASGFSPDEVAAVCAVRPLSALDLDKRLRAIASFRTSPAAESLAAANKRISNILKKSGAESATDMNFDLLQADAEKQLADMLVRTSSQVSALIARREYPAALDILAGFREPVDRFFDDVMVMDPDPKLRANRLALLRQLSGLFLGIADISSLQPVEQGA